MKLTLQEVIDEVKNIAAIGRRDEEVAHRDEDKLHVLVLQAIADGIENPAGFAREALKTRDLDFPRHCA
jgi:hypothetical protein